MCKAAIISQGEVEKGEEPQHNGNKTFENGHETREFTYTTVKGKIVSEKKFIRIPWKCRLQCPETVKETTRKRLFEGKLVQAKSLYCWTCEKQTDKMTSC